MEIRLGTIGSGPIVHTILDFVKVTDGMKLVAVYSRTEEKAAKLACEYGAEKIYTDMDAFLQSEEMNFVYIASPNLLHYEQTKKVLLAGKNVICEKPFCTKVSQARELVELAKAKGLFLIDAVPTTFVPNYEILVRELPKIGKIKLVMGNYSQYSSRYDLLLKGEVPNIFNPEYAGGCLMDINFYNLYLNVALFGKPIDAKYYPNRFGELADTSGILMMQYDGFVSSSMGAKDTWGVNFFQIEGEKGYIYIKDGSNGIAEVRVVTKTSDETFNEQGDMDRRFFEVQNITKLVLADDYEAIYKKLDIMVDVIETLEKVRIEAGLVFPGDCV